MSRILVGLLAAWLAALPASAGAQHGGHGSTGADAVAMGGNDHAMGPPLLALFLAERLEYQSNEGDALVEWEVQGYAGRDLNKFWFKTEGAWVDDESEIAEAEVQALYSRAVSPFFDLQFGYRHDFEPGDGRHHAVFGVQGLAPYWFEVDAAAFVSDDGDVTGRVELEYELFLTQRLILQPRVELELAAQDIPEYGTASGLSGVEAGLRLRYEIRREFAPYLGVSWRHSRGDFPESGEAGHGDGEAFSLVAGIRFWF